MSISSLPILAQPEWLREIVQGKTPGRFPLRDLLRDSLYYPASGVNGTPIKFLVGNVYSFIYTDILTTKEEYLRDLRVNPPLGYELVYEREIGTAEVAPDSFVPLPFEITIEERANLEKLQQGVEPFGHWSIWRSLDSDQAFSLFFLRGEINAVFQGLYVLNNEKPKYLAIIQPGHADGILAWEDIRSDTSHFHELVMNNPAGAPEYLISGNAGESITTPQETCYREYEEKYTAFLPERCASISRLKQRQ